MQFSLHTPRAARRDEERRGSPSTLPGAWRDSAISQLDAIAAASDRRAASRLRTQAVAFALVGLFVLATSAWWARRDAPTDSPRPALTPPAPVVTQRVPVPRPEPVQPSLQPPVDAVPQGAPHPRSADPASSADVASAAVSSNAKPRTVAAEPPAAERRPRESPGRRAQAASVPEPVSAAEPPPRPVPSPAPTAPAVPSNVAATAPAEPAPRPGVASVCGGSAFLAGSFCQARECRKAEHHADPICVRLREIEQARERAAADR